ncbi:hypothetical protein FJ656_27755 [Schumannella luteola]|uniref:TIGR02206 family membrane protein n=1 Tax=Schumannella luteola TaxID=472059 RepID=A0A852YKG7_9MICO|nr:hypothetical protein [Schumannella luteola]TPX01434.1 hypothetical protein FJ656_27755 [Schumannella luteola]
MALLAAGVVTFLVIDPLLAWDEQNPWLGRGRLFLYFTTQSNALAVAAYAAFGVALLRGRRPGRALELLRGLATVDMAITGIVHGLVLADPSAPWSFSEFVLHQAGPILIALWWIALPPSPRLSFAAVPLWLAHPLIWTAGALTYRAESSDGWAPYFFLDPTQVDGWGGVATFVAVILVAHAVLGAGAVLVSRAPWARRG